MILCKDRPIIELLPGYCAVNIFLSTEEAANKSFLIWVEMQLAEKSILLVPHFHLSGPVKRSFSHNHIADIRLWESGGELVDLRDLDVHASLLNTGNRVSTGIGFQDVSSVDKIVLSFILKIFIISQSSPRNVTFK